MELSVELKLISSEPDYSQQLQLIVHALNRPALPTWVIALLSAALGVAGAMLAQVFQYIFSEYIGRQKMRRVIYPDLGSMYSIARHFVNVSTKMDEDKSQKWKRDQLEKAFRFEGEKYARENLATYLQLREYPHLDVIYSALRSALVDDEYGFDINGGLAVEIIEDSVRLGWLPARHIKRYMGEADARKLLAIKNKAHPPAQTPTEFDRPN